MALRVLLSRTSSSSLSALLLTYDSSSEMMLLLTPEEPASLSRLLAVELTAASRFQTDMGSNQKPVFLGEHQVTSWVVDPELVLSVPLQ